MKRSLTQFWVAAACLLGGVASPVSGAALVYGGTPTVPVSRPSGFVPQIMYSSSLRQGPVLLPAQLTVSGASIGVGDVGMQTPVVFNVHYTGGSAALDVGADAPLFVGMPVVEQLDATNYRVTIHSSDLLPVGSYKGSIRFRMCSELPCVNPLAATTRAMNWSVRWANPGDWETFQRDARHDGYVPVAIRPSAIRSAWEWQRTNPGVLTGINAVVSSGGRVFVSDDTYFNPTASLYAFNEATGALLWHWDFSVPALNPPAVSGNRVYVASTGHDQTFLYAFDVADGTPKFQSTFAAQWPHVLAPTVAAGVVYTNGGYYGGGVYAYDANDGLPLWSAFSGDDDMTTPAVDNGQVYYYDGTGLKVYDAFTGTTLATIADPYGPGQGYSYHGAPMVGSPDNVTTFSGGAFSGRASSDVEQYESRGLLNFSIASQSVRWRTASLYKTQPAVANGVVYAGKDNPKSLDAISESTGQVLWSWVPAPSDTTFHRNVVVTRNLVFVSTDQAVYAIDLVTHKPVWSWPTPGSISISGDGYLFVAEGATESNGHLHAFKVF